jgi:homoserine kinase type II
MNISELNNFIGSWDIGEIEAFERPSDGATNDVFLITVCKNQKRTTYVLVFFLEQTLRSLPWVLHLQQELLFSGIRVAQPVANKRGKICVEYQRKTLVIFDFIDGRKPLSIDSEKTHDCYLAGQALAKLHQFKGTQLHRPNPVGVVQLREELSELDASKISDFQRKTATKILNDFHYIYAFKLPINLIHADFFPDNGIVSVNSHHKNEMAMIDWEYCCHDLCVYDLAISLNAWCTEDGKRLIALENAMIEGYQSEKQLTKLEKECLTLARQQAAVRFWVRRLLYPNGKPAKELWDLVALFDDSL